MFTTASGSKSPKFSVGTLDDQDSSLWIESGGDSIAGTASVTGNGGVSGSQGVTVVRNTAAVFGGDKRYWPAVGVTTPTTSQSVVTVSWDMNVARNNSAGVSTGPFFGIEGVRPEREPDRRGRVSTRPPARFCSGTPRFLGGFNNTTADSTVALGQWNHYSLSMNFTDHTANVYVNGDLKQVVTGFDSAGVTAFSDADLSAIGTDAELFAQTGSAVFDNYTVTNTAASVPEPASIAGAILLSAGLLKRRSGCNARG